MTLICLIYERTDLVSNFHHSLFQLKVVFVGADVDSRKVENVLVCVTYAVAARIKLGLCY